MRLRLVVPPLLVALAAAGIWAATHRGSPAGPGSPRTPGALGPASPAPPERKWHPEPVRIAELPRTERIPAIVKAPKAVALRPTVRHAPIARILKRVGEVAKRGEVVFELQPASWERELAAAEKAGDAARVAAAKEALANLEVRAEEEGMVHRIDCSIGDMPIHGKDGFLPLAYLFDWRQLTWEGTAPGALSPFLAQGATLLVSTGNHTPVAAVVMSRGAPAADGGIPLVLRPAKPPAAVPEPGGEATIHVRTGTREAIVVPLGALRQEQGRSFVDVVTVEGKLDPREVVVGVPAGEGRVEVSGVRINESVAVRD